MLASWLEPSLSAHSVTKAGRRSHCSFQTFTASLSQTNHPSAADLAVPFPSDAKALAEQLPSLRRSCTGSAPTSMLCFVSASSCFCLVLCRMALEDRSHQVCLLRSHPRQSGRSAAVVGPTSPASGISVVNYSWVTHSDHRTHLKRSLPPWLPPHSIQRCCPLRRHYQ